MIGRAVLWASSKKRVERFVSEGALTRSVVRRFVAGNDLEDAIAAIAELNGRGIGGILDLLGEGVSNPAGAEKAAEEYLASIKRIAETGIDTTVAVKPTQLGLTFDKGLCIDLVRRLAAEAQAIGTSVEIDMEQSDYAVDTLDVYRLLSADFDTLRVAMQAYLRRTPVDLETLSTIRPRVRLVKGAYKEPASVAFPDKADVDRMFVEEMRTLLTEGNYPAIATHDPALIEATIAYARSNTIPPDRYEFQMLYGVRRNEQLRLKRAGYGMRVYVPYGTEWYPYFTRRIAERPSNAFFVLRQVLDR